MTMLLATYLVLVSVLSYDARHDAVGIGQFTVKVSLDARVWRSRDIPDSDPGKESYKRVTRGLTDNRQKA